MAAAQPAGLGGIARLAVARRSYVDFAGEAGWFAQVGMTYRQLRECARRGRRLGRQVNDRFWPIADLDERTRLVGF